MKKEITQVFNIFGYRLGNFFLNPIRNDLKSEINFISEICFEIDEFINPTQQKLKQK